MNEVTIVKRRRSWEWRVHDQSGQLFMHGRERSRPAARYQGYRALFLLLSVGPRSVARPSMTSIRQREAGRFRGAFRRSRDLTAVNRQTFGARDWG
jgi:hypothetical protein